MFNSWVRRRIEAQPRGLLGQLAVAAACVLVATVLRLVLRFWEPHGIPYITFFPALMLAAILGGRNAGLASLAGSAAVGSYFLLDAVDLRIVPASAWAGVIAFLVSGGLIVWLCHLLEASVRALTNAHAQEHLLALELQHRVKNTLAIVQAIAAQTLGTAGLGGFKAAFTDRLIALGGAHNLLSEAAWREVDLSTLVLKALEPFVGAASDRLRIEGEALRLPADLVVDLALCLHELAANAMKHGALSTADGHVEVRWTRLDGHRVDFRWSEHGGPVVAAPAQRGFGSRLLERGLSRGKPSVTTEYRPEGLRWNAQFEI